MFCNGKFLSALLLLCGVFGEAEADTGGPGGSRLLGPSNAAGSTGNLTGWLRGIEWENWMTSGQTHVGRTLSSVCSSSISHLLGDL